MSLKLKPLKTDPPNKTQIGPKTGRFDLKQAILTPFLDPKIGHLGGIMKAGGPKTGPK
jgi:hypothetical protein